MYLIYSVVACWVIIDGLAWMYSCCQRERGREGRGAGGGGRNRRRKRKKNIDVMEIIISGIMATVMMIM